LAFYYRIQDFQNRDYKFKTKKKQALKIYKTLFIELDLIYKTYKIKKNSKQTLNGTLFKENVFFKCLVRIIFPKYNLQVSVLDEPDSHICKYTTTDATALAHRHTSS